MPRLEGDQALDSGLPDRLGDEAFAAGIFQYHAPIIFDWLLDGMFQVATEYVSLSMIDVILLQDGSCFHG
jgi:hypothetical protein